MGDVWRLVRRGEDSRVIVLDCENVVIGRNVEPKYRIDVVNISRQHACFKTSSDGTLKVTDLRSRNGVFVNGAKIAPSTAVPLREGDIVGFGKAAACGGDVYVFTVVKNNAPVAPNCGLSDASNSAIVLSDDDDIVVTEVVPAKRRRVTSAVNSSPKGATCPTSLPPVEDACPPVKIKKECSKSGSDLSSLPAPCTLITKRDRAGGLHTSAPVRQQTPETVPTACALVAERGEGLGMKVKTEGNAGELSDTSSTSSSRITVSMLSSPVSLILEPATVHRNFEHRSVSDAHQGLTAFARLPETEREESAHSAQKGQVPGDKPACLRTHIKEDPEKVNVCVGVPYDVPKNIKEDPEKYISNEMNRLNIHNNRGKLSYDVPMQNGISFDSARCETTAVRNDEVQACAYSMPLQKVERRAEHGVLSRDGSDTTAAASEACEAATSVRQKTAPKIRSANASVKKEPAFTACSDSSSLSSLGASVEGEEAPMQSAEAPEIGATSISVKMKQAPCDRNSNSLRNQAMSGVPKEVFSVAKNGQSSPAAGSGTVRRSRSEVPDYGVSLIVKPCSVVVQRLESVVVQKWLPNCVNKHESSSEDEETDQDGIGHSEMESLQVNRDVHDNDSHGMQFSQNDVIIILSDSEDEGAKLTTGFEIKKEPEEMEGSISNDADVEDTMPWVGDCLNDFPVEGKDESAPSLAENKELERRLVWNDPDPEETTGDDQDQQDDDFFPELSQNFYDDLPVPEKKIKTSSTLAGRSTSLSSSASCQPNYADRLPKSLKRKENLKDKLMKSLKHRVPMAGGGSAVQKKSDGMVQNPSSGAAGQENSKKSHYKERFQSRTVHLLNTQESLDAAVSTLKKKQSRSFKTLSNAQPFAKKAKTSTSSDASAETVRHTSPLLKKQATISVVSNSGKSELPTKGEPCFTVPAFKQAVRISRVAKHPSGDAVVARADEMPMAPPLVSLPVIQVPEPMDIEVTEKRARVRFQIEHPSDRTDEQRAEFAERVRASLKRRRLDQIHKCKATLDFFILDILNWKVQWLKEQLECSVLPPLVDMEKFRNKRFMYSNLEEYKMTNYYFLCVEVWQSVFRNWREYFSRTSRMTYSSAVVSHMCPPGDLMILTCMVVATRQQMQKSLYPIEGHLVRLDLRIQDKRSVAMPVFGFVMEHKFVKDSHMHKSTLPKLLEGIYVDGCALIALKIQVKARPVTLDFKKLQRLSVVSKITPTLRQMEAVSLLEKSSFAQCIARPNVSNFWHRKGSPMKSGFKNSFSDEQHEVISSAVAAVNVPGNEVRVVLLHGPPGTGKTHTIVGIVTELLCRNSKQTMLIVAPSNAAVDEIGRRLLTHRQWQYNRKVPSEQMLKVVRIGQDSMVHPDVRGIRLEELLQKNIQKEGTERVKELERSIIYLELEMKKCAEKKAELMRCSCPDERSLRRLDFEADHLRSQLQQTKEKKRAFQSGGRQSRSILERKLAILRGAHVVLSTLNSCRSRLMEEAFGRNSARTFSCVLVDEATQCTEAELLLCLQYQTSKLILVGDPMQLPATVMSQDAVERGFQESLFERFYNYLNLEAGSKPTFTLSEQRRMHSEICLFPSRNFYGGKLRPIVGLDAKYSSFPLTPYLVFNISDSSEANEASSTSWLNHGEAAFVARLCHSIYELSGPDVSLGVITPYQAQKTVIVEQLQLQENLPRGAAAVDVNTVDGFQGQERDVIVLSCVRAHHPRGCIGFVADARRLNVAITRARKALFICAHLDSLKDTEEWRALICDAHERCKIKNISANCPSSVISDIIRKPYSTVR